MRGGPPLNGHQFAPLQATPELTPEKLEMRKHVNKADSLIAKFMKGFPFLSSLSRDLSLSLSLSYTVPA
jgi:hypothetical protein